MPGSTARFGGLLLDIQADLAGLRQSMDGATGVLVQTGTKLQKIASGIGMAIGAAVGGLSVGGFARLIKSAIDSADELGKLAQKVGVSVDSLSGLSYAASLSGVDLDALKTGLVKLSKIMESARGGSKESAEAFLMLGLTADDASGPVEKMLGKVADRFAQMPDGALKSTIAVKLFGKAGADLIPLLNGGSAGLASARAEAERLGTTISTKTAKAAEHFNDNLTTLETSARGLTNSLTTRLLPALEEVSQDAIDATQKLKAMLAEDAKSPIGKMLSKLSGVGEATIGATGQTFNSLAFREYEAMAMLLSGQLDRAQEENAAAGQTIVDAWANVYKKISGQAESAASHQVASAEGVAAQVKALTGLEFVGPVLPPDEEEKLKALTSALADLRKEAQLAGASENGRKLLELKLLGASPEQIAEAAAALDKINAGDKAAQQARSVEEELKGIGREVRQLGMTDQERRIDSFLELNPKTMAKIEKYREQVADIARNAKQVAAYSSRAEGKQGVQGSIASVGDRVASMGLEIRAARTGEDPDVLALRDQYYSQSKALRTDEDDAAFERFIDQLKTTKDELARIRAAQQGIASLASTLGDTITSAFLAPLQKGFEGLKTILELVKQAFLDLIATVMRELVTGMAIKILSSLTGIHLPGGESKGFWATLFGFRSGGKVRVANGLALPAFAGGGKYHGPGGPTSDRGLALLSNGERITAARPSAYYGDRLMSAINRMAIPRSALAAAAAGGVPVLPLGGRGGGEVHYHFASLDPMTGLDMMREVAAPGIARHLADGQAGLLAAHIRGATKRPRAY